MALASYSNVKKPNIDNIKLNTPPKKKEVQRSVEYKLPILNVLKYSEGVNWTVDYYRQVLSKDDPLEPFDPNTPSSLREYEVIKGYRLRVTDPLSSEVDQDTNTVIVKGGAIIYGPFTPNVFDVFLATLIDGTNALFTINNVSITSYTNERAYQVEYTLTHTLDSTNKEQILSVLNKQTVKEFYYDPNANASVPVPILSPKEYETKQTLEELYWSTVDYYFDRFYDYELRTILIPDQNTYIYDPFMIRYINAITNTDDHINAANITMYDIDVDPVFKKKTILDILLNRDRYMLKNIIQRVSLMSKSSLPRKMISGSIRYTKIDYIVYEYTDDLPVFTDTIVNGSTTGLPTLSALVENTILDPLAGNVKVVPDVDTYYVLSQAFYTGDGSMTVLDKLVKDYLNKNAIDPNMVYEVLSKYNDWSTVQQFYYIPVLWILVRDVSNNLYGYR